MPSAKPAVRWLNPGDEANVPILLYHHISDEMPGNRYSIGTATFRAHMEALHNAGWTAITTAALADALQGKIPLPEKAAVITFDDGTLDVYQNGFPIMREMGFPGVFFVVSSALSSEGYVHPDQLKEMIGAGWEVGSHSMTHADLTKETTDIHLEMYHSAVQLETALDISVQSFAYPFSVSNEYLYQKAAQYGYTNASCAGWDNRQSTHNIFCLSRREVKAGITAEELLRLVAEP